MIPIHELLHRIRWDAEYGRAAFVIGYFDRVRKRLLRVPFENIRFEPGDRFSFELTGEDGVVRDIPYHRVREVWRNGVLVWERAPPRPPAAD